MVNGVRHLFDDAGITDRTAQLHNHIYNVEQFPLRVVVRCGRSLQPFEQLMPQRVVFLLLQTVLHHRPSKVAFDEDSYLEYLDENLDEGFLNNTYTIDPKITIYAIVNSIVDGGASSQVQILVNGESDITYMGTVDLSKPLSRDQNLVEEKE